MLNDSFFQKWLDQPQSPSQNPSVPTPGTDPQGDIELVTQRIETAGIDLTADYGDWLRIGFALADVLGEAGRAYYHRLSRFYPAYNQQECDRQYDNCLRSKGHGVTIRTFFQLAKDHGISVSVPSLPSKPSLPSPAPFENQCNEDSRDANDGTDGSDGKLLMPTFYGRVKDQLPPFLQKVAAISDSEADADMLILGTLAAISACLPNIYAIYARRELFTNLYLFVTARAGSGKGRLSLCRAIVDPIHEELRAESNKLEMDYREEKERYKRQKKGEGIPEPTPPPIRLLFIPANSSATAVYQALNENDGQGLLFETEGDVLAASFGQDFGDFSQGLRQGFQNEPISYLRRTEREYVCIKQPRISTILSGTPQQVTNLMTSVENGLFSRFLFYCLDKPLVWLDVLDEGDGEPLDDHFKVLGSQFFAFYHSLQKNARIKIRLTAEQGQDFNKHFDQVQTEYYAIFGDDTIASVRRLAVSTYRIAMILTALRMMEDCDFSTLRYVRDDDYITAMTISSVLQQHMLRIISELPKKTTPRNPIGQAKEPLLLQTFWDNLPDEFEAKDFKEIASSIGLTIPTAERYIRAWTGTRLEKVVRGKYRKRKL